MHQTPWHTPLLKTVSETVVQKRKEQHKTSANIWCFLFTKENEGTGGVFVGAMHVEKRAVKIINSKVHRNQLIQTKNKEDTTSRAEC